MSPETATVGTSESAPDRGVTDEDLLHASQSAHYHLTSQAIRFPGGLDEGKRTRIQEHFDAGDLEPVPVQITTRNRQSNAVRVRSQWDGIQLHLDVCPTSAPVLALRPALAAMVRFYAGHRLKLAALLLLALAMLASVIAALAGVV